MRKGVFMIFSGGFKVIMMISLYNHQIMGIDNETINAKYLFQSSYYL